MTEKQYLKYLLQVNSTVIKITQCWKCQHKDTCDQKLKEYCVKRYAEKSHDGDWTFEKALAKENEKEQALKNKINELKKKLKEE